ncbi:MAG: hypothetical protein J3R72DRAFT_87560 [Linnemannia gamsii]|nr:MAG: hypothetical protein J3R72DRAFT_87560 [Linnemannia gamsii]
MVAKQNNRGEGCEGTCHPAAHTHTLAQKHAYATHSTKQCGTNRTKQVPPLLLCLQESQSYRQTGDRHQGRDVSYVEGQKEAEALLRLEMVLEMTSHTLVCLDLFCSIEAPILWTTKQLSPLSGVIAGGFFFVLFFSFLSIRSFSVHCSFWYFPFLLWTRSIVWEGEIQTSISHNTTQTAYYKQDNTKDRRQTKKEKTFSFSCLRWVGIMREQNNASPPPYLSFPLLVACPALLFKRTSPWFFFSLPSSTTSLPFPLAPLVNCVPFPWCVSPLCIPPSLFATCLYPSFSLFTVTTPFTCFLFDTFFLLLSSATLAAPCNPFFPFTSNQT